MEILAPALAGLKQVAMAQAGDKKATVPAAREGATVRRADAGKAASGASGTKSKKKGPRGPLNRREE
jgi:hypothetical protein